MTTTQNSEPSPSARLAAILAKVDLTTPTKARQVSLETAATNVNPDTGFLTTTQETTMNLYLNNDPADVLDMVSVAIPADDQEN